MSHKLLLNLELVFIIIFLSPTGSQVVANLFLMFSLSRLQAERTLKHHSHSAYLEAKHV